MPIEAGATRLAEFVRERVGDGLRGVVTYTPDRAEVIYLRSDLEGAVNLDDFEATIHQARELHAQLATVGHLQGRTMGQPMGNVSLFEHSIVLILVFDEDRGVIATLNREVGRQLVGFVEECGDVLRSVE